MAGNISLKFNIGNFYEQEVLGRNNMPISPTKVIYL
jgi:hypothetical protein